jgi:hypothetical protein
MLLYAVASSLCGCTAIGPGERFPGFYRASRMCTKIGVSTLVETLLSPTVYWISILEATPCSAVT